jgi:hypothetical protein
MPLGISFGFDRNDGLDFNPGTVAPEYSIIVNGIPVQTVYDVIIPIQEVADSPDIERAEQYTIQHVFTTDWVSAIEYMRFLYRGAIYQDNFGDSYKIISANCKHGRGEETKITVTSVAMFSDVPPDEISIVPTELGVNIIKYPRYLYALLQQPGDSPADSQAKQSIVRLIQQYIEAPTEPVKNGYATALAIDIAFDSEVTMTAKAAAQEIIQKLWLQEDSPYLPVYQVTWTRYYYYPQYLNPGGYKEDPMFQASPHLPEYFAALDGLNYANGTVFDRFSTINPQCYKQPDGTQSISWLRKSDQSELVQGVLHKITSSWIGSPLGNWDAQLYNQSNRPTDWWITADYPFQLLDGIGNRLTL